MQDKSRRELMKRLGLIALAGYAAPNVAVVRDALADDDDEEERKKKRRKKKRPPPSGADFDDGHGDDGGGEDF